jgi:hypothetical protein
MLSALCFPQSEDGVGAWVADNSELAPGTEQPQQLDAPFHCIASLSRSLRSPQAMSALSRAQSSLQLILSRTRAHGLDEELELSMDRGERINAVQRAFLPCHCGMEVVDMHRHYLQASKQISAPE